MLQIGRNRNKEREKNELQYVTVGAVIIGISPPLPPAGGFMFR
jgi:hypothetical protein